MIVPALLALLLTAAEPAAPGWQGVWQGQVGTLPVRVCLVRRSETWTFGSYYYISKLRPIRLEPQVGSTVWQEGEASSSSPARPRWTFAAIGRTQLTGTWSDAKRSLPFRLTRVASADEDSPCGSEAFNAPRWRALAVNRAAAVKDGVRYTKLTYNVGPAFPDVALKGFALISSGAATQRINAALHEAVPGKDEDWRSCVTGGLDSQGRDGDYDASVVPTLITPRWLGAELSVGSYCGGAHPNSGTSSLTFDRVSGAAVDLSGWLNDAAIERRRAEATELVTVRPALRRVIVAHAGEIEPDCREPVVDAEFWDIGLERGGLRFTPEMPHVLTPCANPALVPWAALTRFFSRAGVAGRVSLAAK